jgi:PhzF family phenazine biosynthesis protein
MKSFQFRKLDAFTSGASLGNPAGCVLLDALEGITEEQMQRIARELGGFVSEVGYVRPTPGQPWDFELRFFSREREVDFCGHATVAIMHDLLRRDPHSSRAAMVSIKTHAGCLEVENRIEAENLVFIRAPEPKSLETAITSVQVLKALNLENTALDPSFPMALVNAGLDTLLLPIRNLSTCLGCRPDYETLRRFCLDNRIEIVTLFTFETSSPHRDLRTRVFAPAFGYLEDPATGSGSAALGYHLSATGRWRDSVLRIEQGPSREAPNAIVVKKMDTHIQIGGQGVCRMEGAYFLV